MTIAVVSTVDASLGKLAKLPPEVRQVMYWHTFGSSAQTHTFPRPGRFPSIIAAGSQMRLPVLYLSKKINKEATEILFQSRTIRFESRLAYNDYVQYHSKAYRGGMRSLELEITWAFLVPHFRFEFNRCRIDPLATFARDFPALKELNLDYSPMIEPTRRTINLMGEPKDPIHDQVEGFTQMVKKEARKMDRLRVRILGFETAAARLSLETFFNKRPDEQDDCDRERFRSACRLDEETTSSISED